MAIRPIQNDAPIAKALASSRQEKGARKPAVTPAESSPWPIEDDPLVDDANCASMAASSFSGISPRSKSPLGLYPAPAVRGSFPTLSLRIFPWMPDPVPRRPAACTYLFLYSVIGLLPGRIGSASRFTPRDGFSRAFTSRLQLFCDAPASNLVSPPDRAYRFAHWRIVLS